MSERKIVDGLTDQIINLVMNEVRVGTIGSCKTTCNQLKKALAKASKNTNEEMFEVLECDSSCGVKLEYESESDSESESEEQRLRLSDGVRSSTMTRKNGSRQEVFEGAALQTRGGLHKEDLKRVESKGTVKYVSTRQSKAE
jgi:hypothetical protein